MSALNGNGLSFKFAINDSPCASFPEFDLLGRDNPYRLNVKLVDQDGKTVSGIRYTITSTNDDAHLVNVEGMGREYESVEEGTDFYIEGVPATKEADLKNMQYVFSVDCETVAQTEKVIGHHSLRMGRLLRWGRPGISANANPAKAVFTTKTERVAKESTVGARWDWGERVSVCKLKVGASIEGVGSTSPSENSDGSFRATPEIDLARFSNVSKATLEFEGGLSDDQFTAVLPSTENDVELYYFQSVAFTKPSVIVGVPAEVTCKLMGLDQKPRANVDLEWTTNFGALQPVTGKTDAQGVAKTACTATDAGSATVTVLSVAQRMIRGTSAAVGVGPLMIVDPVASATQYIEGHSPAIKFSVTLQAAEEPVSGLTVEWFVGDSPQGTSISDSAGKSTRELTFTAGQNTKQVVSARVSDTQVQTTFDVNVYAVEIIGLPPSATEYVIGDPVEPEFSVVVKANGKAVEGIKIEWSVDGKLKRDNYSNASGVAKYAQVFEAEGQHVVSARVTITGGGVSFDIKAVLPVFEVSWSMRNAQDYKNDDSLNLKYPDLRFRGSRYVINVKVRAAESRNAIEGIPFTLTAAENLGNIGVDILGIDESKVSSLSGVEFIMTSTYPAQKNSVSLTLSSDASAWTHVYKLGWLLLPSSVLVVPAVSITFGWTEWFSKAPGDILLPEKLQVGPVEVEVASREWRETLHPMTYRWGTAVAVLPWSIDVRKDDSVSFSEHVSGDGFFAVFPHVITAI